jgi:hypothetical protein
MLYERYATALLLISNNMADARTCEVKATLVQLSNLIYDCEMMYHNRTWRHTQLHSNMVIQVSVQLLYLLAHPLELGVRNFVGNHNVNSY